MKPGFKRKHKTESSTLELKLIRVFTTSDIRYYVSMTGHAQKPYLFHMENKNGRWIIIDAPKLPQWIHSLQNDLEEYIVLNEVEM